MQWPHFDQSTDNQKQLRALRCSLQRTDRRLLLRVNRDPFGTWEALEACVSPFPYFPQSQLGNNFCRYHKRTHGCNWLTRKYMEQSLAAPASVNFKLHCVELFEANIDGTETLLAGEIGFSVGKVYTSLSGWTGQRTRERHGKSQLVLLGLLLKQRGYEFWSLGHCYSPMMEYKRQLGHRIWPREDFRALLKVHRGPFELAVEHGAAAELSGFERLADGDCVSAGELLSVGAE